MADDDVDRVPQASITIQFGHLVSNKTLLHADSLSEQIRI